MHAILLTSMLVSSIACILVSVMMEHCLSGLCYFSIQATAIGTNDSSVMVLIFQRLSLHVGSCAERLCMDDKGGRLVFGFGTLSGHSSLDNISS